MVDIADLPIVYSIEDTVRDAEVDMQGGVANFAYLALAQHVRHTFLKSIGIDINVLMPVVTEVHGKYLKMMGENHRYRIDLRYYRGRLRYHFLTEITNLTTGGLAFTADQEVVFIRDRMTVRADVIAEALARHESTKKSQ